MNCIDAIEGSVKNIIVKLHEVFLENELDDSDYIRNIKAVLNGSNEFVQSNKEIISDPKILERVLYEFSKEIWLSELKNRIEQEPETKESIKDDSENDEYYGYYFDYLYAHDIYPR
jgi:capsular polysaccharide biosynthesis protein